MRHQTTNVSGLANVRGPHTYAAAALTRPTSERHHTANISHHTSGGRERFEDYSPQGRTLDPVYREQEHYSFMDNSQHYQNVNSRHTGAFRTRPENSIFERSKVGCYNCGEFNHVQAKCRFDHKLSCGICRRLGHKSRLCQYYSS